MGDKQAVGGTQQSPNNIATANNNNGDNDAVEYFFRSRSIQPLFTQIELSLSAPNLLDHDITSKIYAMAVVNKKKRDGELEELGRAKVVWNSMNPRWNEKVVIVAFQFEIVQPLAFHVYDVDSKYRNRPLETLKLNDHEFHGGATCVLSEILAKKISSLTLNVENKNGHTSLRNLGALTINAKEIVSSRSCVEMEVHCSHLDNKDLFSKSDHFLTISRIVESGGSIPLCKTKVVKDKLDNLNPIWKTLCLSEEQFGSEDNPLIIECFYFNGSGNRVLIGKLQKSVADLEKHYGERSGANFTLPSPHHGHEKGQLFVDKFCKKQQSSFLDFISDGFELNFMVAVDFTASNGNRRNSDSYQWFIKEVGEVIQFYDSNGRSRACGSGGRTTDGTASCCFNLNGNPGAFKVISVDGIMAAYKRAVRKAGPPSFGPVINKAAQIAGKSRSKNDKKYFVLLIITDGVITDLQATKDALVEASNLPLSILIVGVGSAGFREMEVLHADNGRWLESSTGYEATREIVQFVAMRDVHSRQISVVRALLEKLPGQFLTYMQSRQLKPRSKGPATNSEKPPPLSLHKEPQMLT